MLHNKRLPNIIRSVVMNYSNEISKTIYILATNQLVLPKKIDITKTKIEYQVYKM
jgi:hypothetical protein